MRLLLPEAAPRVELVCLVGHFVQNAAVGCRSAEKLPAQPAVAHTAAIHIQAHANKERAQKIDQHQHSPAPLVPVGGGVARCNSKDTWALVFLCLGCLFGGDYRGVGGEE